MGASAAQFDFASEITTFLVALTGVALVALRSDLYGRRRASVLALVAGLGLLAASGFLAGAFESGGRLPGTVVLLRAGAGALVGLYAWAEGRSRFPAADLQDPRPPRVLVALSVAAALLALLSGALAPLVGRAGSDGLLLGAAVALAVLLVLPTRAALAARLTASAAATLVLIVVVLSVALSSVLSDTVSSDALRRLESQVNNLAAAAATAWEPDLRDAKVVAASLEGFGVTGGGGAGSGLGAALDELSSEFFSDVGLEWVAPSGAVGAVSPGFAGRVGGVAAGVARSGLVARALATGQPAGAAGMVSGHAVAVGAYPLSGSSGAAGVAVVVSPLDRAFVADQLRSDSSLVGALVGSGRVVSAYPRAASLPTGLGTLVRPQRPGQVRTASTPNAFLADVPVPGLGGASSLVAVAVTPTTQVDQTRQSLFRTLFLIALGGSVIAFLLAVAVTAGLQRDLRLLTVAVGRLSSGETAVRTGVESEDEIGTLAEAFDSMAESIEGQADALRRAAREEAALRRRQESIVAGMGEALVALDGEGRVAEMNPAAERLLGVRRRQALGRPGLSVLDLVVEGTGRLVDHLEDLSGRPDGAGSLHRGQHQVPVAVSVGALPDPEAGSGSYVVVLRDLRPERELERMKNEFLSRIGHELRTPLTAILGFGHILARRPMAADQAQALHREILEQSRRLLRTVEMLEFFASAGANRLGLAPEPTAPGEIMAAAGRRWAEKLPPGQVVAGRSKGALPDIAADRRWLHLALDELIDNAVKFSDGAVRVRLGAEKAPDGAVCLTVSDKGRGMSPEEVATAFEEFVQGDSSDTRAYGGLGLGLALARRVAEAHGGRLTVQSSPGKGSRFSLFLPAVDSRSSRARTASGSRS